MGDWRKSGFHANGGDCVEVAAGSILVRDTQNRAGATLSVDADAWETIHGGNQPGGLAWNAPPGG